MRDEAVQDDLEQEDADHLGDHHDPRPDRRAHDLAHVDHVDGQVAADPERAGDRQDGQGDPRRGTD